MTKRPALTIKDGAYCAAAWAGGQKQIDIAHSMGRKGSVEVCVAIGKFLDEWSGQRVTYHESDGIQVSPADRKKLVPHAIDRFVASLGTRL